MVVLVSNKVAEEEAEEEALLGGRDGVMEGDLVLLALLLVCLLEPRL